MQKIRLLALTIAVLVLPLHPIIGVAQTVIVSENFELDPLQSGWSVFGDADLFPLDTFAISSYSDSGQAPAYAGSLFAHGIVDNLRLEFPANPVQELKGELRNGTWSVQFQTRTKWNYQLEATENFTIWTPIGIPLSGTGGPLKLEETNTLAFGARFYRINAQCAD